MSFLTPLYILGALAIAAPIVFHLIRRRPQGEVPFSSLMFLSPSPPRLTRRSRLDNWLLLLLRATALALLAIAFARPFLREAARLDPEDAARQRVAVLLDTSASMRRGELWEQAKAQAARAIAECRPGDELAILAFDDASRTVLGFAESSTLESSRRQAVARARLDSLAPTWAATDLGQALIDAVAAVEGVSDASEDIGSMPRRVVLIGDLQGGSRIDALGGFDWPPDVVLDLRNVADDRPNAGLHRLAATTEAAAPDADPSLRVRVTNDAGSSVEQFTLRWDDDGGAAAAVGPVDVYVPPGESRVVRVSPPPGGEAGRSLRLEGDAHDFDNAIHVADNHPEDRVVVFVGEDAPDDPDGLLYYLERVFLGTPGQPMQVRAAAPSEALELGTGRSVSLVVVASPIPPGNVPALESYVREGGTVLNVLTSPTQAETLAALAGVPAVSVEEAVVDRDVMLGRIDFGHPLFAPFAGAQFNDFTRIHFWKYRRLDPGAIAGARVLARFEDGDPALVEVARDRGRVYALTSGWQPSDSQLARSSKFLPLMVGLLEDPDALAFDAADLRVGDPIPLPDAGEAASPVVVRKPDGTRVEIAPGTAEFAGADQPGVYAIEATGGPMRVAVNLDPSESATTPLPVETLEQYGCNLAGGASPPGELALRRQMRNVELEGRQKLWRWLILAALGVLIVETWLAGRHTRPRPSFAEAASP